MFRFFLFMAGVMAVGTSAAEEVLPCSYEVPIQIIKSGIDGVNIETSANGISNDLPIRAFVTNVTEHINSRLTENQLCIAGAESMESKQSAKNKNHSLLQFVDWPLFTHRDYLVPVLPSIGGLSPSSCVVYSPWIDIVLVRKPVPQIVGVVRWNERQLLADQATLAGAKNVPLGEAMPLKPNDLSHFIKEARRKSTAKPVEERVPPDILWLLRPWVGTAGRTSYVPYIVQIDRAMNKTAKKGAEGYTKLVLALIDRCFFVSDDKAGFYYNNILDVADPVLLEQYRIDKPIR
jgi:hypothetical protein